MSFSSERLSIARRRRMLKKKDLADRLGVTQMTVTRWETGETEAPTDENLDAISDVLGFPKEFFFGRDVGHPERPSFRSQTSMSAAVRDAAISAGSIGFLVSDWLDERFNLPAANLPDLHLYDPEEAARSLREEWGLGERPVSNMVHLLESKGVRVFSLAENSTTVNAFSTWRNDNPFVFLNTVKSAESSRFDSAHELGHLVLHQDGSTTGRAAEDQANAFASAFLMPRSDVIASLPVVHHLEQLLRAKLRWRVSLAALNYRLHKVGLTNDWKYRDFCIEIAKRGFHRDEPASIERERSKLWESVLRMMWVDKTTLEEIASDLAVPASEVNCLVLGLGTGGVRPTRGAGQLKIVE